MQGRPNPWSLVPVAELHRSGPDRKQAGEPIAQCREQANLLVGKPLIRANSGLTLGDLSVQAQTNRGSFPLYQTGLI